VRLSYHSSAGPRTAARRCEFAKTLFFYYISISYQELSGKKIGPMQLKKLQYWRLQHRTAAGAEIHAGPATNK
jgi:hypothetical protein